MLGYPLAGRLTSKPWVVERILALAAPSSRLVPAVDRAARMLELLGRQGQDWELTDLVMELDVPKGAARDILLTLHRHGLVERDAVSHRYRLGLGLARLARVALDRLDVRRVAHPLLTELCSQTGETVLLGVRDDQHIVIADVVHPDHDLHPSIEIGQRLSIIAGSFGKVFLADAREFETYLERGGDLPQYTPTSQNDADVYAAELSVVRARGYALDDEEYLSGVRAASALVRGPLDDPAAAVTVVGFRTRITLPRLEALGEACRLTADEVSAQLGGPRTADARP
jgi:DNA-binding IclR family transcriptional regulator